jgi:hypothetical protein
MKLWPMMVLRQTLLAMKHETNYVYLPLFMWFVQLLDVEENTRLGSQGPDFVKSHSWFNGIC